ncbi:MAG: ribonuclease HI [Desulfopila sp.]
MAQSKFYAVASGRTTGIFTSWPACEAQVKGVAGARYKSFATRAEAAAWLANPASVTRSGRRRPVQSPARSVSAPPAGSLVIYTDGGAINNPGPGGYGVVICDDGGERELSGGYRLTTNNRMEMTACLVALKAVAGCGRPIALYSDSSYLVNGVNKGWARSWRARGWRKADGSGAVNVDLWSALLDLLERERVTFFWLKGHAGHAQNERCDQLAVAAARSTGLPVDQGYERR